MERAKYEKENQCVSANFTPYFTPLCSQLFHLQRHYSILLSLGLQTALQTEPAQQMNVNSNLPFPLKSSLKGPAWKSFVESIFVKA